MHKRIGILGGVSPESTVAYYHYLTRTYTQRYGDYGYPEILIYSVRFQDYADWSKTDRWDLIAQGLSEAGQKLAAAGADFLIIGANTMHLVLDEVRARVPVPVLSLLDALIEAIQARGFQTVGLLGTKFTMEKPFYREALAQHNIEVLLPNAEDRAYVNRVIYDELVAGQLRDESRAGYVRIIDDLRQRGAEAVILGCTEIPLLVSEAAAGLPLLDTTALHAEAALRYATAEA